jgi:hypothetical protein
LLLAGTPTTATGTPTTAAGTLTTASGMPTTAAVTPTTIKKKLTTTTAALANMADRIAAHIRCRSCDTRIIITTISQCLKSGIYTCILFEVNGNFIIIYH